MKNSKKLPARAGIRPKIRGKFPWVFEEILNLTKNLDFRGHLLTFRAKNTPKSEGFKAKYMPKQLLNISKKTSKKSEKLLFWPPNCQITATNFVDLGKSVDF